ncbi:DUF3344 domain-containing protein [Methanoregula sp.]|uniref:DUF3344 domain-containing protein n=1 Tax=Methanoregula sp. TaxID=2052170 RepID=UPI00236B3BA0|nr:DUF3344 domain-containing protein [Methanoregula sp.]MDD1687865.1 DUF3344 domain-containing protein [Methanoregula sp.]
MIIAGVVLLAMPAAATYAADRPLTGAFSYEGNGDCLFSTGNSTYSGTLYAGGRYPVAFTVDLPQDAIVKYQRYYVYWAWSRRDQQTVYPTIAVTREPVPTSPLEPVSRYVDNKGFSSPSDFYSGMDTFSGGTLSPGKNEVTLEVENAGEGNSTFVIQGIGIIAVYESPSSPKGLVIVEEGCDMLYNSFGITPQMATSRVDFSHDVDTDHLKKASLELVAPSGGYSRSDIIRKNALYVNSQEKPDLPSFFTVILDLVFPNAQGKEWTDVFFSDQQQQIGIDTRDVTPYITKRSNFIAVQDRGDYLLLTNAILHIEYA